MNAIVVRRRQGLTSPELLFVVLLLAVLLGLARHAYLAYHARALTRLCHEQQKRLQKSIGALGISNLDVDLPPLLARVASELSTSGDVVDPGFASGSGDHYVLMAGSLKVGCIVHGSPFLGSGTN